MTFNRRYTWDINEYFHANVDVRVKAGIPIYFSGRWQAGAEYTYDYKYSDSQSHSTTKVSDQYTGVPSTKYF